MEVTWISACQTDTLQYSKELYFWWPSHILVIKNPTFVHTVICHNYFWHLDISSSYIPMMTDLFNLTAIALHCTLSFQHAGTERYPSVHLKGYRLRLAAIINSHINKGDWELFDCTATQTSIKCHIWPPTHCSELMLIHFTEHLH